tara:strand:- start:5290 stop:5595 length:306 start_codon:yes stop_codon:yes gene_type:complete
MQFCGSRPSRARGLKLIELRDDDVDAYSRPSRARGLKRTPEAMARYANYFASITGAWIETDSNDWCEQNIPFASITGAWIETFFCKSVHDALIRVHHGRVD